mmetsp:Transcript_63388/g.138008  ORF Transcript_63388/g.138008 Transcript_63388/m.138008 type:complete len:540 (-) Transcript_63388:32-1651(-)
MERPFVSDSHLAGQLRRRTHHGGAVLWYLRRHAPMPPPFSQLATARGEATVPATSGGSAAAKTLRSVPDPLALTSSDVGRATPAERFLSSGAATPSGSQHARASTSTPQRTPRMARRSPKLGQHRQRRFLHEALVAIGAELDGTLSAGEENWRSSRANSARHRELLRRNFAAHTEDECERLRANVQDREAEVASLEKQVEDLDRCLEATRAASARRTSRLRGDTPPGAVAVASGDSSGSTMGSSVMLKLARSKQSFLMAGGASVFDAEQQPCKEKSNSLEVWQHTLVKAREDEAAMQLQIDLEMQILRNQTVRRKFVEASLFNAEAEAVKLRVQMQHMEARVTRLADELRRVYQSVPDTIRSCLERQPGREKKFEDEISAIKANFHEEHTKFKDGAQLKQEVAMEEQRCLDIVERTQRVAELLEHATSFTAATKPASRLIEDALSSLREAWPQIRRLTEPSSQNSRALDPTENEVLLREATMAALALQDMLELMKDSRAGSPESMLAGLYSDPPHGSRTSSIETSPLTKGTGDASERPA